MKPKDLIKKLELLQPDADVVVEGYRCDILADYQYDTELVLERETAKKDERGVLHATYSNYARGVDHPVYVIKFGIE